MCNKILVKQLPGIAFNVVPYCWFSLRITFRMLKSTCYAILPPRLEYSSFLSTLNLEKGYLRCKFHMIATQQQVMATLLSASTIHIKQINSFSNCVVVFMFTFPTISNLWPISGTRM